MLRIVVLALAFTFAAASAFAQGAGAVARGEQVYAAQKCMICHAVAGKGNKNGSLDGVGAKLSADEIRQWIVAAPDMAAKTNATRKPVMRAFANLPKEDLDGLVAYLSSLKK